MLEEGASGFLQKKITADESKDTVEGDSGVDWASLNKVFSDGASKEAASFGSKHWSSVYLASTPHQAAQMGLNFPGVDEVTEEHLVKFFHLSLPLITIYCLFSM